MRAAYELSLDEFRGLYISHEQIDRYVAQGKGETADSDFIGRLMRQAEALRLENERRSASELPWYRLTKTFQLSRIEQEILLLALAPEIDIKYETLYAYLNNDVSRKWLTCELALRVLASSRSQRIDYRPFLLPQAKLFRHGILRLLPPPGDPPRWLPSGVAVSPTITSFLLNQPAVGPELSLSAEVRDSRRSWSEVPVQDAAKTLLQNIARHWKTAAPASPPPILVFEGRSGSGRTVSAEALAHDFGCALLIINLEAARSTGESCLKLSQFLSLHQQLYQVIPYIVHGELLADKEGHPVPEANVLLEALADTTRPAVISSAPGVPWQQLMKRRRFTTVAFSDLSSADRVSVWKTAAAHAGIQISENTLRTVADCFVLTPGQIERAVAAVFQRRSLAGEVDEEPIEEAICMAAARDQSDQGLAQLASKVRTVQSWSDLVLPQPTLAHLETITAAIRSRSTIYETWGFGERLGIGKGFKILFSGPSGTGKTLTAGVMARDLGWDLYKIDLSAVVSKYIGETEKNLDRIFRAAHCSNAILFFDEADALFGKRSEVKDAHDRYANIEVAYLLQKLEEHEGVVILATNLSKNIDDAFSRRMHHVVRFSPPGAADRERLWRGMFPKQAPLDRSIDFNFIADQFSFSGGEIKNITLDAAFRAAAEGGIITMAHLLHAIAQHLLKEGRAPTVADFRQFYDLLAKER